jgi:hypothetical protein
MLSNRISPLPPRGLATDCLPDEPIASVRHAWSDGLPLAGPSQTDEAFRLPENASAMGPAGTGELATASESAPWPAPIGGVALTGIAGEFTRAVAPYTEADPSALLVHFLVALGNCVGRELRVSLDGRWHHPLNLYAVVIGEDGGARSDAAMAEVQRAFTAADPAWADERLRSGLASGEGLIAAVRDPALGQVKDRQTGEVREEIVDPGVADKRLLAFQPAFGHLLRQNARGGNSLLHVLGRFFEAERVQSITRKKPLTATRAHVSLIAHGSIPDLGAFRGETGRRNGHANCMLWICARRGRRLPHGSALSPAAEEALYERVGEALARAGETQREIGLDAGARELWHHLYLVEDEVDNEACPEAVDRGVTMLLRLAGIYAAADGSERLRREHLEAAREVWRYAKESARHLFCKTREGSPGEPPDKLQRKVCRLVAARPDGTTRGELIDRTQRNYTADELQEALDSLKAQGYVLDRREGEGGRAGVRWFSVEPPAAGDL